MATPAASLRSCSKGLARPEHRNAALNYPSQSNVHAAAANPRRWFAELLWRAFPSRSERDLAATAAPVLDISERQVRNYLRELHDPSLTITLKVLAIAGAEIACAIMEGRR